jgi:hypothetical protein
MLVDKVITAGQIKTPTWIQLSAAVSGGIQDLIDNNGLSVVPDAGGSVDVQGDNSVGLTTTRTGPNTLTVTTVSGNPFLISLTGDDAIPVFGDAANQNITLIGEDGLVIETFGAHTMSFGTESGDEIVTSLKDNQNNQAIVDADLAIRLTTAPLNTIRFDATVNPPNDMNLITDTGGEVQLGLKDQAATKVQPDNEGFVQLVAGSNMTILGNPMTNSITVSSTGATGGTIITKFTASGTFNKNPDTKWITMLICGGGASGGTGPSGFPGNGGPGGGFTMDHCPGELFPNSIPVTVGVGGVTNPASQDGVPGTISSVGDYYRTAQDRWGFSLRGDADVLTAPSPFPFGSNQSGGGDNEVRSWTWGMGVPTGGGVGESPLSVPRRRGEPLRAWWDRNLELVQGGAIPASAPGGPGQDGWGNSPISFFAGATGGGGGATGLAGGVGGVPGGGGGGGGADGGPGGQGGRGEVWIIEYL